MNKFIVFYGLTISAALIGSLWANVSYSQCHRRTFNLAWSPEQQVYTNGTFWINMTTWWDPESFHVTAKINDVETFGWQADCLGLAFDKNHDWKITYEDGGYILLASNTSKNDGFILENGAITARTEESPEPSPYHKCFFNPETGYEFQICFSKTEIGVDHPVLLHISYIGMITHGLGILFQPAISFEVVV